MADAHDCLVRAEILYSVATIDHIPVSMVLDLDSLPVLHSHEGHEFRKTDWARLSEHDLCKYNFLTDLSLAVLVYHLRLCCVITSTVYLKCMII